MKCICNFLAVLFGGLLVALHEPLRFRFAGILILFHDPAQATLLLAHHADQHKCVLIDVPQQFDLGRVTDRIEDVRSPLSVRHDRSYARIRKTSLLGS